MNIMLVSVTERTREIGLRMAVGARRRDILLQFLIEAVTLSLIGGVIGIALGLGGSRAISYFAEWRTLVAPESIVIAFGFAAGIGIFFGFYPARKASTARSDRGSCGTSSRGRGGARGAPVGIRLLIIAIPVVSETARPADADYTDPDRAPGPAPGPSLAGVPRSGAPFWQGISPSVLASQSSVGKSGFVIV